MAGKYHNLTNYSLYVEKFVRSATTGKNDFNFVTKFTINEIDDNINDKVKEFQIALETYDMVKTQLFKYTTHLNVLLCITLSLDFQNKPISISSLFNDSPTIIVYHKKNENINSILKKCSLLSYSLSDSILTYSRNYVSNKTISFIVTVKEREKPFSKMSRKDRFRIVENKLDKTRENTRSISFLSKWFYETKRRNNDNYIDDYHIDEIDKSLEGKKLYFISESMRVFKEFQQIVQSSTTEYDFFLNIDLGIEVATLYSNKVSCKIYCPPDFYLYNVKNKEISHYFDKLILLLNLNDYSLYIDPNIYYEKNLTLIYFFLKPKYNK